MRLRGVGVGVVMAGLIACSDATAPTRGAEGDLEISLPVRAGADAAGSSFRSWRTPVSEQEIALIRRERTASLRAGDAGGGGQGGDDAVVPFIWSKYLTAGFLGSKFEYKFGFVGFGTGYVMSGKALVMNDSGRVIRSNPATTVEENLPFFLYMHPDAEGEFQVPLACGAVVEMQVTFEVYAAPAGVRYAQAQQLITRTYNQPACPAPTPSPEPNDGGGGPIVTETNDGYSICYYEVWTDLDGNVIDVFALGCVRIGTYAE